MTASSYGVRVPFERCPVGEGETGFLDQQGLAVREAAAVEAVWLSVAPPAS